jgi:hypothetical protein
MAEPGIAKRRSYRTLSDTLHRPHGDGPHVQDRWDAEPLPGER